MIVLEKKLLGRCDYEMKIGYKIREAQCKDSYDNHRDRGRINQLSLRSDQKGT